MTDRHHMDTSVHEADAPIDGSSLISERGGAPLPWVVERPRVLEGARPREYTCRESIRS
jgi:hypothetical protein